MLIKAKHVIDEDRSWYLSSFEVFYSHFKPEPWENQRDVDEDWVNEIYSKLEVDIELNGRITLFKTFILALVNGKHVILDGQHTYGALCMLYRKNKFFRKKADEINVTFEIVERKSERELRNLYIVVNSQRSQAKNHIVQHKRKIEEQQGTQGKRGKTWKLEKKEDKKYEELDIITLCVLKLSKRYPNITEKSRRPSYKKSALIDTLEESKLVSNFGIRSSDELFDIFVKYNDTYSQKSAEHFKIIFGNFDGSKVEHERIEKFYKKITISGFHIIGLFKYNNLNYTNLLIRHLTEIINENKDFIDFED